MRDTRQRALCGARIVLGVALCLPLLAVGIEGPQASRAGACLPASEDRYAVPVVESRPSNGIGGLAWLRFAAACCWSSRHLWREPLSMPERFDEKPLAKTKGPERQRVEVGAASI